LIGEPMAQPGVEAHRQCKHSFVAVNLDDITRAVAQNLAVVAVRKMLLHRTLQLWSKVLFKVI
jgi:hypothetical protein